MHTLKRIDPRQIKVEGLIGQRLDLTWKNNLLALDWDKDFLAPFKSKTATEGYVGLGKTLDGLVHFANYTQNPELLSLRKHVIDEVIAAQLPDGYLGWYVPEARVAKLWDIHEMSYITFALVSDWRYFRDERSLQAASKIGDYLIANLSAERLKQSGDGWPCIELATIGLDRAMLALFMETKDQRCLDFCINVQDLANWNLPIVEGRHGKIEGHVYAYLTRCVAQIELYQVTGDEKLLDQTRGAMDYLRRKGGLVITGSCGQTECWDPEQTGTGDLGETCTTGYLIRIWDKLLGMEGDGIHVEPSSVRGDLMERAIYNALFAAQSPDGRKLRYYVPFEGPRVYWDLDTYCCPGNFRRIMSELPEMIYYTHDGRTTRMSGLVVNLYTASRLNTKIASGLSLEVHQETDYPNSGNVALHLHPSMTATFTVTLRIPSWCREFMVKVNGSSIAGETCHGFLTIEREWKSGDTITLEMEMPWRLVRGFKKQQGRVAVMRGPMLFCLNPKRNKAIKGMELQEITIEPSSLRSPVADNTVRSEGLACPLKAYSPGKRREEQPDLGLVLTEFADPDGEATYFLTADTSAAVEDELLE